LATGRPPDGVDLTVTPHDVPTRYVSRYIDELNSPQFPFGFGLEYTTFSFGPTSVSKAQMSAAELNKSLSSKASALTVTADVANTGSRAGDELVQLYVGLQGTSTAQPVRALKGYQWVSLSPGETKKVTFNLGADAFAIWNDDNQYAVEPAKVNVWIAPDSASGSEAKLQIVP